MESLAEASLCHGMLDIVIYVLGYGGWMFGLVRSCFDFKDRFSKHVT